MLLNGYATIDEIKTHIGGTFETDAVDDIALDRMIDAASRYLESQTGRYYYPRVETLYLDTPSGRGLYLRQDILAVITLTNGDGSSIAATEYNLYPLNLFPKDEIRLKTSSTVGWSADSSGNVEGVITLTALCGYHPLYAAQAWKTGSTVNESLTSADLTITMTDGTNFAPGQIIKIENELMNVAGVAGVDVTVEGRGANGSTAATHASTTAVTIWQPMREVVQATYDLVVGMRSKRSGVQDSESSIVTASGFVITPRDLTRYVTDFVRKYRVYL